MIIAANKEMYGEIIDVWEASVRATHHFITESYLQEIKTLLPHILPKVTLVVYQNDNKHILGFAGVAENKLEMLFILPLQRGRGIGRQLLQYAVQHLGVTEVEVNEQNPEAVGFYKKMGFTITATKPLDGMGRPHPLFTMNL